MEEFEEGMRMAILVAGWESREIEVGLKEYSAAVNARAQIRWRLFLPPLSANISPLAVC